MSAPNSGIGKSIAIANRKGGTGKTTTAVNISAALGQMGQSVLLIDLDPQRSATIWYGEDGAQKGTIEALINEAPPSSLFKDTIAKGVDLVPSTGSMASADALLEQEQIGQNEKLKESLEGEKTRWDYVILDCPANFGRVTMNALVAAEELVIPVEASDMAIDGTADLLGVFEDIQKYHNPDLSLLGVLLCRVDHRTNHAEDVIRAMRRKFEEYVLKATIAQNVDVQDSYRDQVPTVISSPEARASKEYMAAAREIGTKTLAAA